jgi:hypothetical protein
MVPTSDSVIIAEPEQQINDVKMNTVAAGSDTLEPSSAADNIIETRTRELDDPSSQMDTPDVPVRFSEKKNLHWTGKTCALNRLCEILFYINNCLANRSCPIDDGWKSCKFIIYISKCLSDLKDINTSSLSVVSA